MLGDVAGLDVLEYGCGARAVGDQARATSARRSPGSTSRAAQLRHATAKVARRRRPGAALLRERDRGPASRRVVRRRVLRPRRDELLRPVPHRARGRPPAAARAGCSRSASRRCCATSATRPATRTRRVTRKLHGKWFGARAFDWGDGTIDFQIPHGEWIALFRDQRARRRGPARPAPAEGRAPRTYGEYVDHEVGPAVAGRGDLAGAEAVIGVAETALLVPVPRGRAARAAAPPRARPRRAARRPRAHHRPLPVHPARRRSTSRSCDAIAEVVDRLPRVRLRAAGRAPLPRRRASTSRPEPDRAVRRDHRRARGPLARAPAVRRRVRRRSSRTSPSRWTNGAADVAALEAELDGGLPIRDAGPTRCG